MYKKLRIVFCIIAVAFAAAAIFVFIYAGWLWGLATVMLAAVCGGLMATFKMLQKKKERLANPPPPVGDFIYGKVKKETDEPAETPENGENGEK
ncbi:MAG: hypothetical protein K2I30_06335 [Clostridia bacterium]|nr:hypothetical protein [Clostridia bacterium]